MPIMATYGWASTIYVVTEAVDKRQFDFTGGGTLLDPMTLDQLKGLQDAGWDVSSHCATHPDLPKLTSEQKRIELEKPKEWLIKNGFEKGSRFFATPYGKRDPETQFLAGKVYENLRDASASPTRGYENLLNSNGLISTQYGLRFQELPSEGHATMAQFRSWVDTAIATGTWLIIVGHTVDKPDGWLDPNMFRRYLKYLDDKRSDIDVLTMSQYWDRRNRALQDFNKSTGRRLSA
jgi:peptidoglycan/xylan/chitin deacetylase (PgdA/CDA1 family)